MQKLTKINKKLHLIHKTHNLVQCNTRQVTNFHTKLLLDQSRKATQQQLWPIFKGNNHNLLHNIETLLIDCAMLTFTVKSIIKLKIKLEKMLNEQMFYKTDKLATASMS